jgi:hypothetical protein
LAASIACGRVDVFESLPSITIDCHHIEGIDTEVDAIDMAFIERKSYRTRDHSAPKGTPDKKCRFNSADFLKLGLSHAFVN